jgi:hypothetical protein
MKITKSAPLLAVLSLAAFSGPCFAQQSKVFNWLPANDESVRLDPANYHAGLTYHTFGNGGNIQVDIKAEQPVTIFLVRAEEWNDALQHPEGLANVTKLCPQEHVVESRFSCFVPPVPMTLVVHDERNSLDPAVFAGLGAVLDPKNQAELALGEGIAAMMTGQGSGTRRFKAPNDVHIQYFRWDCVENCIQPEFQWIQQAKEKYQLSSFLKVYGGYTPGRDAEVISIKIKSPVPMLVAVIPSAVANQLHGKPDMLEPALEKNSCQQRGVQSQTFQCTFNAADGPQSLIVVPEDTGNVPHKKAEIEFFASKCVVNCALLQENANASAEKLNP